MDIFNTKYIAHLEREIEKKEARILHLESRLDEIYDHIHFERTPDRFFEKAERQDETDDKPLGLDSYTTAEQAAKAKIDEMVNKEMTDNPIVQRAN